jgi:hypothetical protein
MGFTPQEVDGMALWQFAACADGWAEAHGGRRGAPMSDARAAELGIEGFDA